MSYSQALKRTVYTLKRKYPTELQITSISTTLSSVDTTTGVITPVRKTASIKRAIALPEAISILAQSGFTRLNAGIQLNTRSVILDKADAASIDFDTDVKVVLDDKEWDVAKVINHEGVIVELQLKEIEGSPND